MYTVQCIATDNFLEKFKSGVIHDSYMVRIPTYRTAYVEHQLRDKEQHGRHLVCSTFRRMEVPGINSNKFLMLYTIAHTEFIGAYCITL